MKTTVIRIEEMFKLCHVLICYYLGQSMIKMSPTLAGFFACRIWFTPIRGRDSYRKFPTSQLLSSRNLALYPKVQSKTYGNKVVKNGTVVLVHGWGGSSNQFAQLAKELINNEFQVILFDFPGHGLSRGFSTDLWEMKEILKEVIAPIEGSIRIISHSFGLFVTAKLIEESDKKFNHVVAIASPHRFDFIVDQFLQKTKFKNSIREKLIDHVQLRVKNKINVRTEIDVSPLVSNKSRWLYIHDENDREVSIEEFNKLCALNPRAQTFLTKGLGHNKILQNEHVISKTIQFLRS